MDAPSADVLKRLLAVSFQQSAVSQKTTDFALTEADR
jgi:hypothetical protein